MMHTGARGLNPRFLPVRPKYKSRSRVFSSSCSAAPVCSPQSSRREERAAPGWRGREMVSLSLHTSLRPAEPQPQGWEPHLFAADRIHPSYAWWPALGKHSALWPTCRCCLLALLCLNPQHLHLYPAQIALAAWPAAAGGTQPSNGFWRHSWFLSSSPLPGSSVAWHVVLGIVQDDALIEDIIDRLLDVRTGRPGKQVALSETEVCSAPALAAHTTGAPLSLASLLCPKQSIASMPSSADPAAVPHSQGDFYEPAQPAGAGGAYKNLR